RATPKFVRGMIGALIAAAVVIVLRFALQAFGVETFLSDSGPIAILISLAIIVVGALSFILDFDLVDQSVNQGAHKQFAWYCTFGVLLGLIRVSPEVLRLLSYLRGSDCPASSATSDDPGGRATSRGRRASVEPG